MVELDPMEKSIEDRKAEIEEYRRTREQLFESMNDEQTIEFLINMYTENEKAIKNLGLNTISEEDIR